MTDTRYWEKVPRRPDDPDACWFWCGALTGTGYGRFWLPGGRVVAAHRYAWSLAHGPVPAGTVLAHSCDEASCVRPDHLEPVDQADNVAQMAARGRGANGRRRALGGDVRGAGGRARAIRAAVLAGATDAELARLLDAGRLWRDQLALDLGG